jgi:pimeloyl-ACP methyl ester carboxylesterase
MHAFVYDFAQLVHTLGHDQVTIVAHSLGGNIATRFAGLYPDKVRKLVNIEGLGPAPQILAERAARPVADRLRDWIGSVRDAAGRQPRRYPTLDAALARMKEANSFLSDAQARHLTINGAIRNEDGSWSWKFDNYTNVRNLPGDLSEAEVQQLWAAIECPVLLFYGTDSFASNPEKDGRIRHFRNASLIEYEKAGHWLHHDQLDRFLSDVRAFLAD